jgi:hypothetical protein
MDPHLIPHPINHLTHHMEDLLTADMADMVAPDTADTTPIDTEAMGRAMDHRTVDMADMVQDTVDTDQDMVLVVVLVSMEICHLNSQDLLSCKMLKSRSTRSGDSLSCFI